MIINKLMVDEIKELPKLPAEAQTIVSIVGVVFTILVIIGWWKIFKKAGEAGWKSIIPIYNIYILYKISWSKSAFWKMIFASIIVGVFEGLYVYVSQNILISLVFIISAIILLVMTFKINFKLSRAFGHGFLFGLGLFLFPYIFELILGFGGSKYVKDSK